MCWSQPPDSTYFVSTDQILDKGHKVNISQQVDKRHLVTMPNIQQMEEVSTINDQQSC